MDEIVKVENSQGYFDGTIICIPVFNDWDAAVVLIEGIDREVPGLEGAVSVLLVDDGSTQAAPDSFPRGLGNIEKVEVIHLRRNLGHQRAIAIGLAFIHATRPCRAVVVMDGDGEDKPQDVRKLVTLCREQGFHKIIFAKRAKRTERLPFLIGYEIYKILHYILTGVRVEIGNFSVIPFGCLRKLVGVSELWNHYAAAVLQAQLPFCTTPIARGNRIRGRSKMKFTSLVVHGLRAISVYGETVGVRLLGALSALILLTIGGLVTTAVIKLFTELAIPGWATTLTGILSIVFLNLLILAMFSMLLMLQSRDKVSFLPVRDWHHFVDMRSTIHG